MGALRLPTLQNHIPTSRPAVGRWVDTVGALRLPTLHYIGRNTRRAGKRSAPATQPEPRHHINLTRHRPYIIPNTRGSQSEMAGM